MIENIIGKRYAKALSFSIDNDLRLSSALGNVENLWDTFHNVPELGVFFSHPGIQIEKKVAMINDLCDKIVVELEVRNLLLTLLARQKIFNLKNVLEHFRNSVDDRLNQIRASVISAFPLEELHIKRISTMLETAYGKKVLIETFVDESIIGGIILRIGGLVADASMKNRLSKMKRYLEKGEVV